MLTEVIMPKLGLTMEQGTVQAWRKPVGAAVQQGEMLLDIETDKTVVEVEAPATGYLRAIIVSESSVVPVGTPLGVITTTADEPYEVAAAAPIGAAGAAGGAPQAAAPQASAAEPASGDGTRLRASPAARRRARELNVDLSRVRGSGPGGLIGVGDVEAAAGAATPSPKAGVPAAALGRIALTPMRRAIARAMTISHRTIPVFTLNRKIRAAKLMESYRTRRAQSQGASLTVTDLLLAAVARVIARHPGINASFVGDPESADAHIVRHASVNLGLAVATDAGLVVPVISNAAALPLAAIAERRRDLVERARAGRLRADESSGATFSVSNLGGMGIDSFTAVINPPEAAILAVGRVIEEPLAEDGRFFVGPTMSLTLSADHRVIDGALGAAFLADLADALEQGREWN